MRLPFHAVTLILFAVAVTATPPPGYVHRPNDDKNPPSYRYQYEIGDANGKESHGKEETRSGELASGRYYVNEERSSTDVKYFADEWGYHPLVKYGASNDHSSATAHFALGEHVVKAQLDGTEVGDEVKLPVEIRQDSHRHRQQPHRRRRPVQVIQPYTQASSGLEVGDSSASALSKSQPIDDRELPASGALSPVNLLLNYDLQRTVSRGTKFRGASPTASSSSTSSGFQENFNNYVTLPRTSTNDRDHQRQSDVREEAYSSASSSSTPDYRSLASGNIYVTKPSTTGPPRDSVRADAREENHEILQESTNDQFSTVSDDFLLVQNAGSFGRRLNPAFSNDLGNGVESTTRRVTTSGPISSTSGASSPYPSRSTAPTPRTSPSHPTELEDRRYFSTTPIPDFHDVANSVSAETLSKEYKNSFNRGSAVSGSYADIFARIFSNSQSQGAAAAGSGDSPSTENFPSIRYQSGERNDSLTKADRATTPGLSAYGKRPDHELYVTLRQSLESEIGDLSKVYSSTPRTLSTYSSKPIVVAELSDYNSGDGGFEYSTTFPCTDERRRAETTTPGGSGTDESSTESSDPIIVGPTLQQPSNGRVATSSVVPNPIQAGASLSDVGETEPTTPNNRANGSPAPVTENIDGEPLVDELPRNFSVGRINELETIVSDRAREELYEKINPAFGQTSGMSGTDVGESITNADAIGDARGDVGSNSPDQQIEIQKSVEIYQNAPVHEIHYPPEVISQVSGINHQVQQQQQQHHHQQENSGGAVHQREELPRSYVGNAKQFQQRYNNAHDQQRQSINAHDSVENSRAVQETEPVHRDNPLRVDSETGYHGTDQRSQVSSAEREGHAKIIKIIRDSIPEVKYTPARPPQINVQVYPSSLRDDDNNARLIETERGTGSLREQRIKGAQAVIEGQVNNKVQSELQRILTETGGVQRYFSGAGWTRFREQQGHREAQQQGLEDPGKLGILRSKPDGVNDPEETYDTRGPQAHRQQSIVLPYVQGYDTSEKNLQTNLGNVEEMTQSRQVAPVSYLPPPVAERIVQKTVHVPQPYPVEVPKIIEKKVPYPVEKIVERKVPYPVEKIVEKKVPVPQPYPVHIQVPVDRIIEKQVQILQPYPVHIEKIIEKKVPYPVQRLVPQPYPVHILQSYPVEKPVHIPVTVEKIVEKKVHVPHPYPVQVPIKVPYPVEITKYVEQSVQVPYGVRYGVSYQQIMKPQSTNGLYGHRESTSLPVYGLSLVSNQYRDRPNASQDFHGYSYDRPAVAFVSGSGDSANPQRSNGWEQFAYGKASGFDSRQVFAKKSYVDQSSKLPLLTYNYSGTNRRKAAYRQNNVVGGDKVVGKDEYVRPVSAAQQQRQQQQQQQQSPSKPHQKSRSRSTSDQQPQLLPQPVQQHSTAVTRTAPISTSASSSRRARQQEDNPPRYQSGPGAFRQSKMEYGFKPPMVPSIQYDEKTATKVEN